MLKMLRERVRQGHRTIVFPGGPPALPPRFRGLPVIDASRCPSGCRDCADACPTEAIDLRSGAPLLDLGRCLFCTDCTDACPEEAIRFTGEHRLSATRREDLIVSPANAAPRVEALEGEARRIFGRSLRLRQVSAGGCNGCEADVAVLGTIVFDLGRFGVQFVASPRHADGLLITGPVTRNMREALRSTWDAVPGPKFAIAVGACAISGGPYAGHPEAGGGAGSCVPIDLYVPGCPPHPVTILDGILLLLGRIASRPR